MKILVTRKLRFFFSFLLLLLFVSPVFAQRTLTIRLSSPVPENTAWGQVINRMAAEWTRITNGQINMIVIHGGTAGSEEQVMALVKANTIQAGVFTSMGLNKVVPELMSLSYPFLIRSDAELAEVLQKLRSDLDGRFAASDLVTLTWAHVGWVKLFTRTPIATPDDLRRLKLASSPNEHEMLQAFRTLRYNVVPSDLSGLLMDLQNGRIDAAYISPAFAASGQLFGITKNMLTVNVAPFMGAILMNQTTWRRIPDRFKPELLAACRRAQVEIEASFAALEADAVTTMVRYGLVINDLTPAQMQVWYDDTTRYENSLVGPIFNRDYYYRINRILTDFRANSAGRTQ